MDVDIDLPQGRVAALIPAAGSGQRMGGNVPKPFLRLGGREILARTLDVFETCRVVSEVWIVVAPEHCIRCQQAVVERYGFHKVRGVVAGAVTRQASVWQGLQHIDNEIELVVVHDGVRPFVPTALVHETVHQAARHGAAIAAVPLKDTLRRVSETGEAQETVPREGLWRIQTPQTFRRHLLYEAFLHAWQRGIVATDEAGLLEVLGHQVRIVPGVETNVKITTPDDLPVCEGLLHRLG
ncbi:2-C-methyl-D-erythritol 4-phosphate cytidylyltransferase [Candidatus Entotheonellaceae bacterium PAL068K]